MGIRLYGVENNKKTLQESQRARDIVSEILNFGVSQNEIMYIIHDLAMNLEDTSSTKRITSLCKDILKRGKSALIDPKAEPKKALEL